jgi:GT2 family glycosyltransferase
MYQEMSKIFIVILNWNGKEDTCQCVQTVQKIEYSNYDIVIVDNGSQDDSIECFKKEFPEISLVETGANLGYAGGNNQGISYALSQGADYILLLNNDAIVDPLILNNFIDVAESRPKAGIFGAKIYYLNEPQRIWFAGGKLPSDSLITSHEGFGEIDDGLSWEEVKPMDYACGCALFFKSDVVKAIGFLEDKFFLMWEETDFCYRARRAGFECLFVPKALVWHKISASFKGGDEGYLQSYFMVRNRLLWIERNISVEKRLRFYITVFLPNLNQYVRGYLSPNSNAKCRIKAQVNLVAVGDYILRKFGDCPNWIRSI